MVFSTCQNQQRNKFMVRGYSVEFGKYDTCGGFRLLNKRLKVTHKITAIPITLKNLQPSGT